MESSLLYKEKNKIKVVGNINTTIVKNNTNVETVEAAGR